ncbi:MAG: type II secretion system protein [Propionibacteriaceae bacterium]|jgi:tight adherence protein B|nr:type II secretion system protein [Propionibacteriaceae bacterium]
MTVVAAGAAAFWAGLAVWLWSPPGESGLTARLRPVDPPERRSRPRWLGSGLALVALIVVGQWSPASALVSAVGLILVTGAALWRRRRRGRQALLRRRQVARACRVIDALLAQGLVPRRALTEASQECPILAPAAATAEMGGDSAAVLRRQGRQPGADGLVELARAWAITELTGAPLHGVLTRVKDDLAAQADLAGLVDQELAAARATGHLLAGLPLAGLGLGYAFGVDPLAWLTGSAWGRICLTGGVALACLGALWSEVLADRATVSGAQPAGSDGSRPARLGRSLS